MAPIQRDGLEYEFDVFADLDQDNTLIVYKTRCPALAGGVFPKAGKEVAAMLNTWLQGEAAPPAPVPPAVPSQPPTGLIDASQLKRLITVQKECGVTDEAFKAHLMKTYRVQSRKLIPAARFQDVLGWLARQHDARLEAEERATIAEEKAV